jgi:cystathionine gamma-synthase
MAAVSAILKLFSPKDHIIVSDDLYGGTYRIFEEIYKKYGIDFSFVDTSCVKNIEESITPNTAAIFIETPSNPMMKITDLRAVSELSKAKGILSIVDNTFLTPYYQRPLELGIDLVLHSGTKYLGGHNDTLAGLIVVSDDKIAEDLRLIQKSEGAVLAPFDSWLILRGLKTLGIRLDRQQYNAQKIANWLKGHKKVEAVYYAGLLENDGYKILNSQASGYGAMVSLHLKDAAQVESILERVKVFIYAESLGGVESLITYPIAQTHKAIPSEIRERLGVNDRLLRLSVGIEDINDLINDLEQAMS